MMRTVSQLRSASAPRGISVPISLVVGDSAVQAIPAVLREVELSGLGLLVVSGSGASKHWGERVYECIDFPVERHFVQGNTREDVVRLDVCCAERGIEGLIAVGGGRVIDVCKAAAKHRGLPVLVVPTALSSDCIASPISVIRDGNVAASLPARMPLGVIIDLALVEDCPRPLLLSGLGDLLSNLSASLDWQLAVEAGEDRWDGFADILARQAAEQVLFLQPDKVFERDGIVRLAEGLVMSGIAMEVAGSSRPCSGAEHTISHAIDALGLGHGSHGEQVALGVLYVQALRKRLGLAAGADEAVRMIRTCGLPRSPADIGVSRDQFLQAVRQAPSTRPDRFTVLSASHSARLLEDVFEDAFAS